MEQKEQQTKQEPVTALARRRKEVRAIFENPELQKKMGELLSKEVDVKRLTRVFDLATTRNPTLLSCTDLSLYICFGKAAELRLDPSGTLGQAYLIPFKNSKTGKYECQFIAGYQGLIELCYRSGKVKFIDAQIVYEKDNFDYELGTNPFIHHRPDLLSDDRGKPKCVYAVAQLEGSDKPKVEILSMENIKSVQKRSRAGESGPWRTDFDEMARKTGVRRLVKYLPKSPEMQVAIGLDDAQFDFEKTVTDQVQAGVKGVKERIKKKKKVKSRDIDATPEEALPEETPDPEFEAKKQAQLDALNKKKKKKKKIKKKAPVDSDSAHEPASEDVLNYRCNKCGRAFRDPTMDNQCPHCLSHDVVDLDVKG
jgi:recombination protein RecT